MNWLSDNEKQAIRQFASQEYTEETCGFVLHDGQVLQVPNGADDRVNEFSISPELFAEHEEHIKGIWHTHLELAGFSQLDQQVISADVLPWAVYCLRNDSWHECDPTTVAPFQGRPFVFGCYDCYSLVSDKLATMGVTLPDWKRGRWGEWNTPQFNPFDLEWKNYGKPVMNRRYQAGDILLMTLGDYPGHSDHVGVMTDHKHFLHHPSNGISRSATLGSYYERRLNWVVRPFSLCKS